MRFFKANSSDKKSPEGQAYDNYKLSFVAEELKDLLNYKFKFH